MIPNFKQDGKIEKIGGKSAFPLYKNRFTYAPAPESAKDSVAEKDVESSTKKAGEL